MRAARALTAATCRALLPLVLASAPAAAATFYVDRANPAASTAGPGSETLPYSTIASALAARSQAGNVIVVKAGTYREQVSFPASGAAGAPIVLQADGEVVVDGADDFSDPAKWTATVGTAWLASGVTWTPKQVIVNGVALAVTTADVTAMPVNTFRSVTGLGLYVNLGGVNPGERTTYVGRRLSSFQVSGKSWIRIVGFRSLRADDRGFQLVNGAADVEIVGNTVQRSAKYGIYVTESTRIRIAGNLASDNANHGIMLTTGTTECVVEDNESCRNAVPDTRLANGIHLYGATRNVLRRNRWHDNQDSGQHLQSGANDNLCLNNLSWNNGDHGYDHLGATGTLHLNDVAYGNYKDGFSIEGVATGTRLHNCIAVENGLTTNEFDLWVDSNSSAGFESNDNIFWNSTAQKPIKFASTQYALLSTYAAATGQDTRSIQANPRFWGAATGNFHLQPNSPALDNADASDPNWPLTDLEGRERADAPNVPDAGLGVVAYADRGALEYQPAGIAPLANLAATPTFGTVPLLVTLDAGGSSDPDGNLLSYVFDFGDGTASGIVPTAQVTHSYSAGTWDAVVTVTDAQGKTASDTVRVRADLAPVAVLSASPLTGRAPLAVAFNASGSYDLDGRLVTYRFLFGDGTAAATQNGTTASHVYGSGTWRAQLEVTDDLGVKDTLETPVTLAVGSPNSPPTAALNASPQSGPARLTVQLDASGSSDPDGPIAWYTFAFGDGTSAGPQSSPTVSHSYAGGTWKASVTVTDADGATALRETTVHVTTQNLAPNGDILTPAARAVTISAGQGLSFTSVASDPDGDVPLAYAWELGGSITSALASPGAVVFPDPGVFQVTLRVTDAQGLSDPTPDTCTVTVLPADQSVAADEIHWTHTGATSITLDWRGPSSELRFGLTPAYGTTVQGVTPSPLPWSSSGPFWEARLTGLEPNTTYHYSVAGSTDHTFHTSLPRGSAGFTVVAEGDIGAVFDYPKVATVQALVASQSPDLVLALGDLTYANVNGQPAVDRFFNDMMVWSLDAAFMPAWGNHEWEIAADDLRNYKGRFQLPNPRMSPDVAAPNDGGEDWYWFDHGNVRFVSIPEPMNGSNTWDDWFPRARAVMDTAQADPAIAFIVTFGHRPAYSSGHHPGEARLKTHLDLLGATHSKYVLNVNGHSHDYERTNPQSGVVHITAGASGSALEYADSTCKWEGGCPRPSWSVYRVMHMGALKLRFSSGGIEGTYIAGPSATGEDTVVALGTVLDHFTIGSPSQDRAPVVSAPVSVSVAEGGLLSVDVTALDPDDDTILNLSADLSRLPAGSDAVFTPAPDHRTGVLTWHPTFGDAGSYQVTFSASNALAGSASSTLMVNDQDRAPIVSVPDTTFDVAEGVPLTLVASVSDPDADPIATFDLDIEPKPLGETPHLTHGSLEESDTLSWTPGYADSGWYKLTFSATNALTSTRAVHVHVGNTDRAPQIQAPPSVSSLGATPVDFDVTVSDPDGDPIDVLDADLDALPAGAAPSFTVTPDHAYATFHWAPPPEVAGAFTLSFTGSNALSTTSITALLVNQPDRAPLVTAPDTVTVAEGAPIHFGIRAVDPDSTAITAFMADLAALPLGHQAALVVTADHRNADFQWTPSYQHAGTYKVYWTASNALSGNASTVLRVLPVDRAPVVTAPVVLHVQALLPVSFPVTASDPDGDAISSLTADLTALPAGHTATFTPAGTSAGTFSWTPAVGDTGTYSLSFQAHGLLDGSAVTLLDVTRPNQPPTAQLAVTPANGVGPLVVTADASASGDGEGPIVSYLFTFGDGTLVGPQAAAVASHTYAPGTYALAVSVTDQAGAVHTRTQTVIVAAPDPALNLCLNPSFETNANGWNALGSVSYVRVPGGFHGQSALQLTGTAATGSSSFGVNDSPNWVAKTGIAGTRYRVTAWVRSASAAGLARIQVREYLGGVRIGPVSQSVEIPLTSQWQQLRLDHVTQLDGTLLDLQITDSPATPGESFLLDCISFYRVPADPPIAATEDPDDPEAPVLPHNGSATKLEAPLVFGARMIPSVTSAHALLLFTTTQSGPVHADLFDTAGRRVRVLCDAPGMAPGLHSVNFDAQDESGSRLGPGVYFYRVQALERSVAGKLVVVR